MSMLKKTLFYLGLGPDEEYDSFDEYAPNSAPHAAAEAPERVRPSVRAVPTSPHPVSNTVRPISRPPSESVPGPQIPAPQTKAAGLASSVRIVESRPPSPHALSPTTFNEAQSIGDRFKQGQAVIVNLQGADLDLRRRLVDFASGLCYALGGKMDRVADQVYLLTPADVVVPEAEAQRVFD